MKLTDSDVIFNVKNYGAKGNGLQDDTNQIIAAITAASSVGGGTVLLERGTYLISKSINVPENVSLVGRGKKLSILKRIDKKDEAVLRLGGHQTIRGVALYSRIGVLPLGNDITILETKFSCKIQGIQNAATVYRLTVINSLFENCGYGILSNEHPSFDIKIINCSFINIKSDGIEINVNSQRWTIENCIFDNNISKSRWAGFGVGVALSAREIIIKNSSFNNIVGQGVHVETGSEVVVIGSSFKNCGLNSYAGSPEADIAVLSNATLKVVNTVFYPADTEYSSLAIYNTDKPVGGTVKVSSSKFYNKVISKNVDVENSQFLQK
ncbi:glycosyl hydrolase family 28-related protein [Priestia megaterium]